jgi:Zn-dependent M28 family amino/carboxypeptidase
MHRWFLLVALAGCGSEAPAKLGPTDQGALMKSLQDLAAFGKKHVGTDGAKQAADYLVDRFKKLGLSDVHTETFQFPRWDLMSSSMTISIDGAAMTPGFDVFEASGSGHADGQLVWCNTAKDEDLVGVDLTGKIALVVRDPNFHRSAQYKNVGDKGAVAMLYLSIAPSNLRQVGSVRFTWEGAGSIPAITIGADDGALIKDAVMAGKNVRAVIDTSVANSNAVGANVLGKIAGERPEEIVIGAHYDTWFAGSTDNGSGVAELLALAERRMKKAKPRYTLVFVAYDGEEVALYGGYDFLRKHKVVTPDPILAVLNFETPSAKQASLLGLGRSNLPILDSSLQDAGLGFLYTVYAGLELVAELLGGIIPTDIQGIYRSGVPTVSTAVTGPYYHTTEDTPDKVDLQLLAESTDGFDDALDRMMKGELADFAKVDDKVWTAAAVTTPGDPVLVTLTVRDGSGVSQPNVPAHATLLVDDFFLAGQADGITDAEGVVQFAFPASVATMGKGNRFVHFGAGPKYPMVEKVLALP